ncbi:glycoside hydrolase family 44 protein [Cohnella fermenti]|uniref:BIG2 domain-containing protein n=1 Tax=Cohnella fermenti TaxID=2565925 RepID=A0A4S4C5W6_9BACL|nr:glycoside hydrolase family 44 protein [Cohnella fermenti]THF83252.1 hypothetical protein E6C55_05190 [Cohnella fermenti]
MKRNDKINRTIRGKNHSYEAARLVFLSAALAWSGIGGAGWAPSSHAVAAPKKLVVYDDRLHSDFTNYSWADHTLSETGIVHEGTSAIRMKPNNDDGLYLYSDRILGTDDYPLLQLWVSGGGASGQRVEIVLQSGGEPVAVQALDPSQLRQGQWNEVEIALDDLDLPNGLFDGILIRGTTSGAQPAIYLDDISLLGDSGEGTVSEDEGPVLEEPGTEDPGNEDPAVEDPGTEDPTAEEPGQEQEQPDSSDGDDAAGMTVYDDALHADFQDNSWAQHSLTDATHVHSGAAAIAYDSSFGGGLYLYKQNGGVSLKEYDRLQLWVNGGEAGGQKLELVFNSGGQSVASVDLDSLLEGGAIPAGEWTKVSVDLTSLSIPDQLFDGLLFRGLEDGEQAPVYLDDIRLLEKYVAPPTLLEGVLSQYGMVLAPGDEGKVAFEARYSNGTSADVSDKASWTSDNPEAVTVDAGRLAAVGAGLAKITAVYGAATASLYVQVVSNEPETVYDDALADGYTNWSWGTQNFENGTPAASGNRSISFVAKGYEGIWMHRDESMDLHRYYGLTLQVHGGTAGGQHLKVSLMDDRSFVGEFDLENALPDGVPANGWTEVELKFADLGVDELTFDGIVISAWGEENQGTVFFDNISLLRNSSVVELPEPELPEVQVVLNAAEKGNTLSPGIFGLNFEDMPSDGHSELGVPIKRWGGNQMTRYNWQLNTTNRGGDWYFLNVPYDDGDPSQLPEQTLSDRFIEESLEANTDVLIQIPTIGWTPKSREIGWSFSVEKYGQQASDECDWKEAWCRADAGNGKNKDGSYVTGNDPEDTSMQTGPEFAAAWVEYLQDRFGDKVHNYALDNEPMLWGHSHWDVHPEMTTYDEVWDYTQSYGSAIKAADPQANIFGPVPWGWCEYFYSAKDGCSPGDDMAAHDGKPYLEWLLEKNEEYRQQNGTRLIDTLDIHYYPAEENVAFSSDESPAMVKRRLNSLKSLYDPNYVDPTSWIQEPVKLIPRMKELIADNAPGMKLSISEYNFGDGNGIGSGLAQAEALALFAREGVDYAMRWGALEADTPLEDAFKLFLNYDGNGSRIQGDVVGAASSNADAVSSYAIAAPDGKTYVLLFNKDSAPRQANLQADIGLNRSAEVYRFEARKRLYNAGSAQGTDDGLALKLPARSATLLVLS